jgi:hypothetical protein
MNHSVPVPLHSHQVSSACCHRFKDPIAKEETGIINAQPRPRVADEPSIEPNGVGNHGFAKRHKTTLVTTRNCKMEVTISSGCDATRDFGATSSMGYHEQPPASQACFALVHGSSLGYTWKLHVC